MITREVDTKTLTPDAEILMNYPIPDEKWHELRAQGIGGSEAAAVMQDDPYSSQLSLFMEKTGRMERTEAGENAEVGTLLEPILRRELVKPYMEQNGYADTVEVIEPYAMFRSKQYPHMLANVDGFLFNTQDFAGEFWREAVGLEIKTGTAYQAAHWKDGEIPVKYWWQVQHYMAVTGLPRWIVFAIIGNRRYVRVIERHDDMIAALIESEQDMWQRILSNDVLQAPLPIGTDADDEALRALGNPPADYSVDLSDMEDDVDRYYSLGKEIKELTQTRKDAKQRIEHRLKNAMYGESGRYQVKRTVYTTNNLDTKRLKLEKPDIAEAYSVEKQASRLNVKELDNE